MVGLRIFSIFVMSALLLTAVSCSDGTMAEAESAGSASSVAPVAEKALPAFRELSREQCGVRYRPAPSSTLLNEPFVMVLEMTADREAEIEINTSAFDEAFAVNVRKESPEPDGVHAFAQHAELTVEPLWHGEMDVPEVLVSFMRKGLPPVVIAVPGSKLQVMEPTAAEQERALDDTTAKTPLGTRPPRDWRWLWWGLGTLALLSALVWGWRRWRQRPSRGNAAVLPPPIPPHLLAQKRLDELLARKLIESGEYKPFYDCISEILRDYIEGRFNLKAPERTTEEFLEELRGAQNVFSPRHMTLLNNFLHHTDLVKYARAVPTTTEVEETVHATRTFIDETKETNNGGNDLVRYMDINKEEQ